jgi:hypothetical protein
VWQLSKDFCTSVHEACIHVLCAQVRLRRLHTQRQQPSDAVQSTFGTPTPAAGGKTLVVQVHTYRCCISMSAGINGGR